MEAKRVLRVLEQLDPKRIGTPISDIEDVDVGDVVQYKKGTELEGTIGLVVNKHKDSVDLKVGKATKIEVPISDLEKV